MKRKNKPKANQIYKRNEYIYASLVLLLLLLPLPPPPSTNATQTGQTLHFREHFISYFFSIQNEFMESVFNFTMNNKKNTIKTNISVNYAMKNVVQQCVLRFFFSLISNDESLKLWLLILIGNKVSCLHLFQWFGGIKPSACLWYFTYGFLTNSPKWNSFPSNCVKFEWLLFDKCDLINGYDRDSVKYYVFHAVFRPDSFDDCYGVSIEIIRKLEQTNGTIFR